MSESFELADADRLTVGTVGAPGHRVFYLQAGEAGRTITLKVEKQQVAVLSQAIAELLAATRWWGNFASEFINAVRPLRSRP